MLLVYIVLGQIGILTEENADNRLITYTIAYHTSIIYSTVSEGASKGRTLGKLITETIAIKENMQLLPWQKH